MVEEGAVMLSERVRECFIAVVTFKQIVEAQFCTQTRDESVL